MIAEPDIDEIVGEARWPMAAAVVVVIAPRCCFRTAPS